MSEPTSTPTARTRDGTHPDPRAGRREFDVVDVSLTIGGASVAGDEAPYEVRDPGRPGDVVLEAPSSSPVQVDEAVRVAMAAGPAWAALPFEERASLVVAAAEAATAAADAADLATLLTRENGKLLGDAHFELATIGAIAQTFEVLAKDALAPRAVGSGQLVARPHGVVAAILPFNWPVSVLSTKVAPALLAGNTVVVKPPPTCPGAALAVAAAMAQALPPGVLGTVNGPGIEVGEALVGHPDVAMVSLTGGLTSGRAVMGAAAGRVAPVVLELGGNDAAIVTADVEVTEALATALLDAALVTSGQVCMALKRLYVPAAKLDAVVEALVARAAGLVTGHGLEPETTVAPVHTAAAAERAEAMLVDAVVGSASVHRPGRLAIGPAETGGSYVVPAIVAAPRPDAPVVVEEQFAPILPVLPYDDLDAAVAAANGTSFGLGASVWSGDDELAASIADRLEAGTVFRNAHGPGALDPNLPFGGWKESGVGLEYGVEGVLAYTRLQALHSPRPLP